MGIFNLFKTNNDICAPVNGFCADISKCADATFANKMLGDGFMILPLGNTICSPCDGTLTMLFPTLHAFGVKMNNGQELLVHIGINTVELKGKYFEKLAEVNDKVKAGAPIVQINRKEIEAAGYDCSVITVVVNERNAVKQNLNKDVKTEEVIIKGN